MSDANEKVECSEHGEAIATFVCRHVRDGVGCGYVASADHPDDARPDAWCDHCDRVQAREGGWNDVSEAVADVSLLCSGCYDAARARNERIPEPLERGLIETDPERLRALIDLASERTRKVQDRAWQRFGIGDFPRWGADWHAGRFHFGTEQRAEVVADIQIVGCFSKKTSSWLWSWANDSNEPHLVRDVARLRVLGEVRGIELLAKGHHENVEEVDCWELTSVARHVLGYEAVYRAPMDHRFVFVLLRNLRRVS
jgi:hypothetical protein